MRICEKEGCNNKHEAHGLCKTHYNRAVERGEIQTVKGRGRPRKYKTDEERKAAARIKQRRKYHRRRAREFAALGKTYVPGKHNRLAESRKDHPGYYMWVHAKRRASRLGLPFNIDVEDIVVPSACPLLGTPLKKGVGCLTKASPTLDRFIPELGYVKGNIWVISHRANTIKNDASIEELELILRRLKAKAEELGVG